MLVGHHSLTNGFRTKLTSLFLQLCTRPVVEGHVHGVIEEVPNGEGYEGVAGRGELGDEVLLHLGGLGAAAV